MSVFPPLAVNAATTHHLGPIEVRYHQSVVIEASFAGFMVAGGLLGLAVGDSTGRAISVFLLLLPGLAVAWVGWRKMQRHVYVCADGLILTAGSAVRAAVAWKDVAHVREWTTVMRTMEGSERLYRCKVQLTDGTYLNLAAPPYVDGAEMAATIAGRVAAALYPTAVDRLAGSGSVEFGPLTLTPDGLVDGARTVRWAEIGAVEVGRVRLVVRDRGGRTLISRQVRPIPDLAVLLALTARELPASVQPDGRRIPDGRPGAT